MRWLPGLNSGPSWGSLQQGGEKRRRRRGMEDSIKSGNKATWGAYEVWWNGQSVIF